MGRLFDAAAAILGLRNRSTYEGQGAMELEAVASEGGRVRGDELAEAFPPDPRFTIPFQVGQDGPYVMDPLPLLSALGRARQEGVPPSTLAQAFHLAVARVGAELAARICQEEEMRTVALSGGVFQNALLLTAIRSLLERGGLRVLVPRCLSPNDGAISYGQAAVAVARLCSRERGDTEADGGRDAWKSRVLEPAGKGG
jgi:hydrogenase maturation protein HypF